MQSNGAVRSIDAVRFKENSERGENHNPRVSHCSTTSVHGIEVTGQGATDRDKLIEKSAVVKREFAKLRAAKQRNRIRRRVIVTLLVFCFGSLSVYAAKDMQTEEYQLLMQFEYEMALVTKHRSTLSSLPVFVSQLHRASLAHAGLVRSQGDGALSGFWWLTRTRLKTMKREIGDQDIEADISELETKLAEVYDLGIALTDHPADSAAQREALDALSGKIFEINEMIVQLTALVGERRGKLTQAIAEHRRLLNEADVNVLINSLAPFFVLGIYFLFSVRAAMREGLEDQLRSTQAHLDLALRDLHGSHEELVERERKRLLGEVTESLAHELRNVLMPITAMSELMLEEERLTENQKRWTEVARICCTDAAVILANMKQYLTVVGHPAKHESIDLVQLIGQVVEFTKPKWLTEAQRRGVKLEIVLSVPKSLTVSGVDTELRQVFTNLLLHSIESMTRSGQIRIELQREGSEALVSIQDQGFGLADSSLWTSPVGNPRSKNLGVGIGLTVSREIVLAYRGSLDFFTADGVGTTCEVRLPVDIHRRRRRVDSPHPLRTFEGLSALCVDDNAMVLESLAALLRNLKVEVIVADTLSVATEVGTSRSFDVVFCDLSLGLDNGLDLLERLKQVHPQMTTVLITGWNHFEPGSHSFTPDQSLTKPISREHLIRCLEQCKIPGRAALREESTA